MHVYVRTCVIPYEPIFHMYIYIARWVWIISLTNTWIKGMDQGYGSPVGPGTGGHRFYLRMI